MQYRRAKTKGCSYFFTVVTHHRRPFLCLPENITLLRNIFRKVIKHHPFEIDAMVVLSDHLHCLWTLPEGDGDFSKRRRLIKSEFSRGCGVEFKAPPSASRQGKKEQAVWQRRFWEHQIRNEQDFVQHVEYIHYNPVKHGYAETPIDWLFSSFHRYVKKDLYPDNWGASEVEFDPWVGDE
jgi:putative transposase